MFNWYITSFEKEPPVDIQEQVNNVNIQIATVNGTGSQSANLILTRPLALEVLQLKNWRMEIPSTLEVLVQ